jgi:uncharacterized membrane protein YjgN (DUF898 family)
MRAAGWGLLALITLGLALPWREAALERYKMRHTYYGDLQGSFEGRGWEFFKRGWGLWLFFMASFIAMFVITPLAKVFPALAPFSMVVGVLTFFVPFAVPFLYAMFKAIEWRWWLSGIRFGGVRLESSLSESALMSLYWKVIGWSVLLSGGLGACLFGCVALIAGINRTPVAKLFTPGNLQGSIPILVVIVIGYLALILALNVVMRVYLLRDVWARVIASTAVYGLGAAANVAAEGELANALGEGFADGLDVAGF